MTEHIIETAAALPKVCEFINIPVQSGDNAVLKRMRRGYTVEEYLEKVALIRRFLPAHYHRRHRRLAAGRGWLCACC